MPLRNKWRGPQMHSKQRADIMIPVDLSVLHIDLIKAQLKIKNILFIRAKRENKERLSQELREEILNIHTELTKRKKNGTI